ncbi:DUF1801 domain-containing protein [Thalassospira sp. A40-3]|uniref:DUF1801 domain-containing protein n=1 Tax=Thalassospira sp. A40-3 TaxID=2785908 RepID=UPI0018CD9092|nr:DUF1801 domain-containing protein [Thalassospira sp. A40-3]QPO12815.1 DUF1801 domain-containing protein [Thalassospira sp. A40-3]
MGSRDFASPDVAAKFNACPAHARRALMSIRGWILELAGEIDGVGPITESLKWGEPAWRPKSGSGITIRADWKAKTPDQVMIFFDCKTDLIDRTRSLLSADLATEGNRAIILPLDRPLPEPAIKTALGWALTYHRDRKQDLKQQAN